MTIQMKTLTASVLVLTLAQTAWVGTGYAQIKQMQLAGPSDTLSPEQQKALKDLEDSMLTLESRATQLEAREKTQIGKASDKMVKKGLTAFWNRWRAKSITKRLNQVRGKLYRTTKKRDDTLIQEVMSLKDDLRVLEGVLAQARQLVTQGKQHQATDQIAGSQPNTLDTATIHANEIAAQALQQDIEAAQKRIDIVMSVLLRK